MVASPISDVKFMSEKWFIYKGVLYKLKNKIAQLLIKHKILGPRIHFVQSSKLLGKFPGKLKYAKIPENRKLRILLITEYIINPHYSNDRFFQEELQRQADITFLNTKGKNPKELENIINKLLAQQKFDIIYKYFNKRFPSTEMKPLSTYGIPVLYSSGDCHSRLSNDLYRIKVDYHGIGNIIVNNKSTITLFKEYFAKKMNFIWIPWAYNPKVHKDYGYKKKWNIVIPAGNFRIPIRKRIRDYLLNSEYKFLDIFYKAIYGSISPINYAKLINKCKFAVSTCQHDSVQIINNRYIGMTFPKYFEIPMCNTLHIAQRSADSEDLGFKDGVNIVLFDTFKEFKEKLHYYMRNQEKTGTIIKNSINVVKNNHTYENRVSQFLINAKRITKM